MPNGSAKKNSLMVPKGEIIRLFLYTKVSNTLFYYAADLGLDLCRLRHICSFRFIVSAFLVSPKIRDNRQLLIWAL